MPERMQVPRALRIPELSGSWKTSSQEMPDQPGESDGSAGNAGPTAAGPPPARPGFRPLTVTPRWPACSPPTAPSCCTRAGP
jgi:hypothetical protein